MTRAAMFQAHDWKKAFLQNGFGHHQSQVRPRILEEMDLFEPPQFCARCLSLEQLKSVWPRNKEIPVDALFAAFRSPAGPVRNRAEYAMHPRPVDLAHTDWHSRLRPRRGSSDHDMSQLLDVAQDETNMVDVPTTTRDTDINASARQQDTGMLIPRGRRLFSRPLSSDQVGL